MDGQVRTWKESDQARGTQKLKSADRQTSQDMKRIQLSEGHSQTGEHRQTDKSGHRKNLTKQGHSPTGECRRMDKSGQRKNLTKPGALTSWGVQMDRQVRTQKESNQLRGTHRLKSTDGQTSQDMERV